MSLFLLCVSICVYVCRRVPRRHLCDDHRIIRHGGVIFLLFFFTTWVPEIELRLFFLAASSLTTYWAISLAYFLPFNDTHNLSHFMPYRSRAFVFNILCLIYKSFVRYMDCKSLLLCGLYFCFAWCLRVRGFELQFNVLQCVIRFFFAYQRCKGTFTCYHVETLFTVFMWAVQGLLWQNTFSSRSECPYSSWNESMEMEPGFDSSVACPLTSDSDVLLLCLSLS